MASGFGQAETRAAELRWIDMGRRSRQRGKVDKLEAPTSDYASPDGQVLTLRGALSVSSRAEFAKASIPAHARAAQNVEDVRARALEFLFERLVARWVISDVPTEGAKALLTRYRVATRDERAWITGVLREHCAEWFPDLKVP
jgi:hypothetical protein